MNNQFTFQEGGRGYNPEKYNRFAQQALSDRLNSELELLRVQGLMDYGISVDARSSADEPFKRADNNQGTEVATFDLVFNLNAAMVDRDKLAKVLNEITTNGSLSHQILITLDYAQELRKATKGVLIGLLARGFINEINLRSLDERISIDNLAEILAKVVSRESGFDIKNIKILLRRLFSDDPIEQNLFFTFLKEGHFRMAVPFVYKRIPNGVEALTREINFYEELSERGFNTFCAFKFLPTDEEEASYEFTAKRNSLRLLRESSTLLDPDDGLLKLVFSEVGRMHSMGFVHGDLSFENIGYERSRDGKYVVFFDFIMSRLYEGGMNSVSDQQYNSIRHDLNVIVAPIRRAINYYISIEDYQRVLDRIEYIEECFKLYFKSLRGNYTVPGTEPLGFSLYEEMLSKQILEWHEMLEDKYPKD